LLAQARSAFDNYIANHDAGDASIIATPGATHDDGYDAGGGVRHDSAQGTSSTALQTARANGPGEASTPSSISKSPQKSRHRQPKAVATSAESATRPRNLRKPTKIERPYSMEDHVTMFFSEHRVAVDLDARMGTDAVLESGCVHGANVTCFVEAMDPICLWTTLLKCNVAAFCSCGGVMGSGFAATVEHALEHVQIQCKGKKSSTCRHAAALLVASRLLSAEFGMQTPEALINVMPVFRGPIVTANNNPMRRSFTWWARWAGG